MKKSLLTFTLVLLIAGGFCAGLARLFALRYASGDVYPPYSTLRADPLGAKVLHDALAEVPGVETRRNFLALKKLKPAAPITLVYLGTPHLSYWTEREFEEFQRHVSNGTRAVIAFLPFEKEPDPRTAARDDARAKTEKMERENIEPKAKPKNAKKDKDAKDAKDAKDKKDDEETDERSGLLSFAEFGKRLGFQFEFLPPNKERSYDRRAYVFVPGAPLERDLTWHTALYFSKLAPEWKPLYLAESQPVLVERSYGRGSIVLASDSFLFSNEALRRERHPQLLARVFNGPSPVIFDEEHLGVRDDPGLAQLAVKYRLQGVVVSLVLIAALFVWKNATRFIPAYEEAADRGEVVSARDSAQGFENLLHRAIPPAGLLEACADQWRRTFGRQSAALAEVVEVCAREQSRPPRQRDPVAAYREIARRLQGKVRSSPP